MWKFCEKVKFLPKLACNSKNRQACKNVKQWFLVKNQHYLCLPCKIPFLKNVYFYKLEFVKKLLHKIKLPKCVV